MKSFLRLSKFFVVTFLASLAISNSVLAKTYTCTVNQEYIWGHGKLLLQHHKAKVKFTFDSDAGVIQYVGARAELMPLSIVQKPDPGYDLVGISEARQGDVNIVLRIREWDKVTGTIFLLQTSESSEAGTCS